MDIHSSYLNQIQRRFWIDEIVSRSNRNNLAFLFKISGALRIDYLSRAFEVLYRENPSFHAYIDLDEAGEPYWDVQTDFIFPLLTPIRLDSEEESRRYVEQKARERFDLKKEFPFGVTLIASSDKEFYLLFKIHHIIIDDPRFLFLLRHLSLLYNKQVRLEPIQAISCGSGQDYTDWEKSSYTEEKRVADLDYWKRYIRSTTFSIPLSHLGKKEEQPILFPFELGKELKSKCDSFCVRKGCGLFRLYASAWAITVLRVLNQDDLYFTYAVDICPKAFKETIGVYINNLLLHVPYREEQAFMEVLDRLSADRRDARDHQACILSQVTGYFSQPDTDDALSTIGFNYPIRLWNNPALIDFEGCDVSLHDRIYMDPISDILLEINEDNLAKSSIFAKSKVPFLLVQALVDSFRQVLTQVVENPQLQVGKIALPDNVFQDADIRSSDLVEKQNFWKNYLADCADLDLPTKSFYLSSSDRQKDSFEWFLSSGLSRRIISFCEKNEITPFVFFLSIYQLLLVRLTRQFNFAVGIPIAGRERQGFEGAIGSFVHLLPYRPLLTDMEDATIFKDYVLKSQSDLEKVSRQTLPWDEILACYGERRNSRSDSPLIQAVFSYGDLGINRDLSNAAAETIPVHGERSSFPIFLEITLKEHEFHGCFRYMAHLFEKDMIRTMASCFRNLTEHVLSQENIPMMRLPSLSREEEKSLIMANSVSSAYSCQKHLVELFQESVALDPYEIALRHGDRTLSYKELDERSSRVALFLYERDLNNSNIGIYMTRGLDMIIAIWGILKANSTYVPLDTENPEERLLFIARDCDIRLIITNEKTEYALPIPYLRMEEIRDKTGQVPRQALPPLSMDQTAYIIYTSGTTGTPKGIPIRQSQVVHLVKTAGQALYVPNPKDKILLYLSIYFDASVFDIFATLLHGAELVIAGDKERKDPDVLFRLIEKERINSVSFPAAFLSVCPKVGLPSVKNIIVGGDCTPQSVVDFWKSGHRLLNVYGPTENTVCTTACVMEDAVAANDIGLPLPGISCYIVDENGNLMPDGFGGELYIGGNQLSDGYIGREELNKSKFIPNPFISDEDRSKGMNTRLYKSGDLVRRLPNGHLLFLGRTDFQVKIRGFRIELGEIENALSRIPGVGQVLVQIVSYDGTRELAAYVRSDDKSLTVGSLKEQLALCLPTYMIPSFWCVLEDFPLTANGKIDRSRLPKPDKGGIEPYVAPSSIPETLLANIICGILGVDRISVDLDLFDFGLTSLQVIQAVFEAEKIGIRTSVSRFYQSRNIRDILRNNDSYYCYWGNEYDGSKPVLLIVCGYPHFNPAYDEFARVLRNTYSLLVLESHNEFFYHKEICTLETLLDAYIDMLKPILKDKGLFGITGLCLGGEIGVQLAYRLSKEKIATPKVFVIDGFAFREKASSGGEFIEEPNIDPEINRERNRINEALGKSFFFNAYEGETHICLARRFTKRLRFANLPEETDPERLRQAFERFRSNAELWRRLLPDCQIHYIEADHWSILDTGPAKEIKRIMDHSLNTL